MTTLSLILGVHFLLQGLSPRIEAAGAPAARAEATPSAGDLDFAVWMPVIAAGEPPSSAPLAVDDAYVTDEDTGLTVAAANGVLTNDSDLENDPLTAALETDVARGELSLNPDGSFDYDPDPDFHGTDTFTYRASDGESLSDPATVTLAVQPVNDPPEAVDDSYQTEGGTVLQVNAASGVLANDTDPEGDPLAAVLVSGVSIGTLDLNSDGSFSYAPESGFSGQVTFTYRASDSALESNLATVTVAVDAPLAVDDAYETDEDTVLAVNAADGVLANDSDPEQDPLTAVLAGDVSHGLLNLNPDGSFDYNPDPDFHGTDSFTYRASDGASNSNLATVTLTVNPVNDPPVAVDDAYQMGVDSVLQVGAVAGLLVDDTDPDGDALTAVQQSDVSSGDLTLNSDGSFEYTPAPGFAGQDSFTYRASDSALESNLATVTITVSSENSPPRIVSGAIAFTKQVIATDVDQAHHAGGADLNGDGLKDVFATDYVDGIVFWYENDGAGGFVSHVLDADLEGAYPGHVGDVDLDGDMDVLAGGYLADTFAWYETEGAGDFTRHDVDTEADGAHSIVTVDMDLDGDVDLLTSSQDAGVVAWYENDGGQQFSEHIIDDNVLIAKRAEPVDMDGDGDVDVVSASYKDTIAWHENDGNQGFTRHVITTSADGAYYVSPTDVDGDSDVDVLAASRLDDTIAWYENLGNGSFAFHAIDTNALGARTVIHADVDSDGDQDAVTASVEDDTVAWYENDGSGVFTTHWIDLAADGAYGVFTTDMDDDGDLDVLSAHRDDDQVVLREHIRAHEAGVQVGGTLVIDSTLLLTVDADDAPVDLVYTLTDAPDFGDLQLNGISLAAGESFTQDDVDNDRLAYVHDGGGSSMDSFWFQVQDGGEGGVQPLTGSFTIDVEGGGATMLQAPLQ